MKDVLPPDSHEGRDRTGSFLSGSLSGSNKGVERLLKEIEEREKYIKQITDKNDSLEKEAYEKGFAQGEKAGRELGEKRFDSVVKSFAEALEEVRRLQEECCQSSEQEMLELVLAIARRVIQKEVSADGRIIVGVIQSALKYVADRKGVKVRLNPSDLELASQCRGEMIKEIEGMKNVILESDETVARGDAIVESNHGIIDAGIEMHLQEVEKALRSQAEENPQVKEGGEVKEEVKEEEEVKKEAKVKEEEEEKVEGKGREGE
jgi:flagellar assembly protein FliH